MIEQLEVDGVPVLISRRPGPTSVGLVFRVGMADETLPTRGITHLIEHLALAGPPRSGLAVNGTTGRLTTTFLAEGAPDRVAGFLTQVCDQLGRLPLDRLETERAVLRAEEAGRTRGSPLSLWRYGSVRHGMLGYLELGRDQITPDQVDGWVRQWFTRDNAALWVLTEEDLPELSLPLPGGARRSVPSLASTALRGLPAFFVQGGGGLALDALVPRTMASVVLTRVLQQELYRVLRNEAGVSYGVHAQYDPVDADWAEITIGVDCLEENEGALVGMMVDELAALAIGRISPDAVTAALGEAREAFERAGADADAVPALARDVLLGRPVEGAEVKLAEVAELDLDTLRAAAAQFAAGALVQVPYGQRPDWGGWELAPQYSTDRVTGTTIPGTPGSPYELVVAADGVSLLMPTGTVTVRFDQAVAWMAWPDGARALAGADGFQVPIEPTMLQLPPGLIPDLDRRTPPHLWLRRAARDPEDIPRPKPAEPEPKRRFWQRKRDGPAAAGWNGWRGGQDRERPTSLR